MAGVLSRIVTSGPETRCNYPTSLLGKDGSARQRMNEPEGSGSAWALQTETISVTLSLGGHGKPHTRTEGYVLRNLVGCATAESARFCAVRSLTDMVQMRCGARKCQLIRGRRNRRMKSLPIKETEHGLLRTMRMIY